MQFARVRAFPSLVALVVALASAACDSSGGGGATTTVYYAGDRRAHGISIRSGVAALSSSSADEGRCEMADWARAAGCAPEVEDDGASLRLALYGCFLEPGDALFECSLSATEAEALGEGAVVAAGCGCQDSCPQSPEVVLCRDDDEACREGAREAAASVHPAQRTTVAGAFSTTQEPTCSTCCHTDFADVSTGDLHSSAPVAEVEFVVRFEEECLFDGDPECEVAEQDGWSVIVDRSAPGLSGQDRRFCLAARDPAIHDVAVPLVTCHKDYIVAVEFESAVGPDFTPLPEPPTLVFD